MRPVRFVALSEDGQALVLADEVGRLLTLSIDDRVAGAVRHEQSVPRGQFAGSEPGAGEAALSPRDIQSRIRSGESAEEVARIAGVPVDRVLRYAGPVLQERAMVAQHARRTRLRSSERAATLAEVVDVRLAQHGVDADAVSWDAYRADDGTWRVAASWASGKATAAAVWAMDKARQVVTPQDDMAQFLSAERPAPLLGQEPAAETPPARTGHALNRPEPARPRGTEPRPVRGTGHGLPSAPTRREPVRRLADAGRGLDRPMERPTRPAAEPLFPDVTPETPAATAPVQETTRPTAEPLRPPSEPARPAAAAGPTTPKSEPLRYAEPRRSVSDARERQGLGFDDDSESRELPAVPSLAVLRPRRTEQGATSERSRLPSWDDVLFGSGGSQQR